jgi:hypothetical protein
MLTAKATNGIIVVSKDSSKIAEVELTDTAGRRGINHPYPRERYGDVEALIMAGFYPSEPVFELVNEVEVYPCGYYAVANLNSLKMQVFKVGADARPSHDIDLQCRLYDWYEPHDSGLYDNQMTNVSGWYFTPNDRDCVKVCAVEIGGHVTQPTGVPVSAQVAAALGAARS